VLLCGEFVIFQVFLSNQHRWSSRVAKWEPFPHFFGTFQSGRRAEIITCPWVQGIPQAV
jgi:hypothetical protein